MQRDPVKVQLVTPSAARAPRPPACLPRRPAITRRQGPMTSRRQTRDVRRTPSMLGEVGISRGRQCGWCQAPFLGSTWLVPACLLD